MDTATTTDPCAGPLTGFTVGVTAMRRREELAALLNRRGARVVLAPTMTIVPLSDDTLLRRATEHCLTAPLDFVIATTGLGWRGWVSAADGWGLGGRLSAVCRDAVILTRGPKATGAVRASGLSEEYSPNSEANDELLTWLLARPLRGRRIAVQEHGRPLSGFAAALRERGAEVIQVPVYRWGPPPDADAVRRLVELTVRRELHAVTFTSAPAIEAFLDTAELCGRREEVLQALRTDVMPVCVGPVCARPLNDLGIASVCPDRGRLGALVRILAETLPGRLRREMRHGPQRVVLQGSAVLVDDETLSLPPVPAALFKALADRPGHVVSRTDLLRRVWPLTDADDHTVDVAVARLRSALGPYASLVRTVPKRGYRLDVTG